MRSFLRLISVLLAIAGAMYWLAQGANTGITKSYKTQNHKENVTGIPYQTKETDFQPGINLLGGWELAMLVLFGISFLIPTKPEPEPESEPPPNLDNL